MGDRFGNQGGQGQPSRFLCVVSSSAYFVRHWQLVGELREVRDRCREGWALHDQMLRLAAAVVEMVSSQGVPPLAPGGRWTPGGVWRDLDDRLPGVSLQLRRVIRDCLVTEDLKDANRWNTHRQVLAQAVMSLGNGAGVTQQAQEFLEYSAETGHGGGSHAVGGNRFPVSARGPCLEHFLGVDPFG